MKKYGIDENFDSFEVDDTNRFIYLLLKEVAKLEAKSYSPLFIHGPKGVGKSHLLKALASFLEASRPEYRIIFISSKNLIEAEGEELPTVGYDEEAVLLVDDVGLLTQKPGLKRRFYTLFDTFYEADMQVVFTSRKEPFLLKDFSHHFISLLMAGIVVTMPSPLPQTRRQVLLNYCQRMGKKVAVEALDFLIERYPPDLEQLKETLEHLLQYFSLAGKSLTLQEVEDYLLQKEPRELTSLRIEKEVEEEEKPEVVTQKKTSGEQDQISLLSQQLREAQEELMRMKEEMNQKRSVIEEEEGKEEVPLAQAKEEVKEEEEEFADLLEEEKKGEKEAPFFLKIDPGKTLENLPTTINAEPLRQGINSLLEGLGKKTNPLVLVGGKDGERTHCLHAIGNTILAAQKDTMARYVKAWQFNFYLGKAIKDNALKSLAKAICAQKLFLLDGFTLKGMEIDFQASLYQVLKSAIKREVQVVIASDSLPKEWKNVYPDLLSLLGKGLVLEL